LHIRPDWSAYKLFGIRDGWEELEKKVSREKMNAPAAGTTLIEMRVSGDVIKVGRYDLNLSGTRFDRTSEIAQYVIEVTPR
jgi:hypothetical protein